MMRYLTHLGGARATIGIGLLLVLLGGEARTVGLVALVANAISHLAVQVLKRAVARPRPCDASGAPLALVDLPDPFSFPSGHSAAALAVAYPIAQAWPDAAPVAIGFAAAVATSRVVLRVHHLSDVLAGAALGVAGVLVAQQLLR